MTLANIYDEFTAGSDGFCRAVSSWCGFDMSRTEIERVGLRAKTAEKFEDIYANEDWWTDANN